MILWDNETKQILIGNAYVTIKTGQTAKARRIMEKRQDVAKIARSVMRKPQASEYEAIAARVEQIGKVEHKIESGVPELYEVNNDLSICLGIVERSLARYLLTADYCFILCIPDESSAIMQWLSRKVVVTPTGIKR